MTGRERRLLRMLCVTASSGGGGGGGGDDGGDKPFDELTWDQVIASTKTGKYKTFTVGDMKELDLGTEGIVHMQIVGIDVDDLADGSGKAPLTFISKELLATSHMMNLTASTTGGWEKCEMRSYLKDTVKPLIPENVRKAIVAVTKYSKTYNDAGTIVPNSVTVDDVWIPSKTEVFGGTSYETLGHVYSDAFTDADSRKKFKVGASSAYGWWLRSAITTRNFGYVSESGTSNSGNAYSTHGVALGFCL